MIYFIQAEGIGHIKIGFTDGADPGERLATLQTGSPVPLRVLHTMPGTLDDEKNLHRTFAAAGVGGEWFKAVPELLALIPQTERKACEGIEIAERTVSIRVLTVGRKQFSKSLLQQIPVAVCFNWERWVSGLFEDFYCPDDPPAPDLRDVIMDRVLGDVWGIVKVTEYGRFFGSKHWEVPFNWVITQINGRLYKDRFPCRPPTTLVDPYPSNAKAEHQRWLIRCIERTHQVFATVPGFRDEDQLFIGV